MKVSPEITREEASYIFKTTDTDQSGSISVKEIEALLATHGIGLESHFQTVPKF